jgi:hypothetical protein
VGNKKNCHFFQKIVTFFDGAWSQDHGTKRGHSSRGKKWGIKKIVTFFKKLSLFSTGRGPRTTGPKGGTLPGLKGGRDKLFLYAGRKNVVRRERPGSRKKHQAPWPGTRGSTGKREHHFGRTFKVFEGKRWGKAKILPAPRTQDQGAWGIFGKTFKVFKGKRWGKAKILPAPRTQDQGAWGIFVPTHP